MIGRERTFSLFFGDGDFAGSEGRIRERNSGLQFLCSFFCNFCYFREEVLEGRGGGGSERMNEKKERSGESNLFNAGIAKEN